MMANPSGQRLVLRGPLSSTTLIGHLLDPAVIVASLGMTTVLYGEEFGGHYLILSLIAFSLTFPGATPSLGTASALLRDIVLDWLLLVILLLFVGYATRSLPAFPLRVIGTWIVLAPLAQFTAHQVMRHILPRLASSPDNVRKAVIVGANPLGIRLARHFSQPHHGIRLVGYFDDRDQSRLGDLPCAPLLGRMDDLPTYVKDHGVDQVYISLPMASQPRILKLLDALRDTTASIYFTPDIFVADLIQARISDMDGIPVVAVCETPFQGINGLIKRISDIVIAAVILLLISPLMLIIALGVKVGSPGPILFKQRRYGLDGKDIVVYKFRSMTVCEDGPNVLQAQRNDKRVTRLGAFLRRTSLDELPQFINVLQGRMSVVGPRPHAVSHNESYRKLIKGYMIRHKVKPGITGWAQVNGYRGETDTLDKMEARIEYDLAYLRNWSLKLDLLIILRTVLVVAGDRHAY